MLKCDDLEKEIIYTLLCARKRILMDYIDREHLADYDETIEKIDNVLNKMNAKIVE